VIIICADAARFAAALAHGSIIGNTRMKTRSLLFVAFGFVVSFSLFAGPKSPMRPGKWQITMHMVVPGIPEGKGPGMLSPMTIEECVTKEEAENPRPPKMDKSKVDCDNTEQKIVGKTVTWTTKCRKPDMTMNGKFIYSGDTYKGESHITSRGGTATYKYNGKYLGPCDKKKDE
jgi:uncharacterized protein DUF3617